MLTLAGETLVSRTTRVLRELFDEVLLSANDPVYAGTGLTSVPDRIPGKGAPGGLHAVLSASRATWVFTVGCDMPFVSAAGARYLSKQREGVEAVLVRFEGRLEPLHAFWSRSCLPTLERLLSAGNPSLQELSTEVRTRVVPESEWRALDPSGLAFANVNTEEDARRLGVSTPGLGGPNSP